MLTHPAPRITDCFCDLVDLLIPRRPRHRLLGIVTIAVCAVLRGAESWVEVPNGAASSRTGWPTGSIYHTGFPPTTPLAGSSPGSTRASSKPDSCDGCRP